MTDKAERLHDLAVAIKGAAQQFRIDSDGWTKIPLWKSIDYIARALGYENYSDFNEQFLEFCISLRDEITI